MKLSVSLNVLMRLRRTLYLRVPTAFCQMPLLQLKVTPLEPIIKLAHESSEPLYVTAIGAITNVASAILLDPEIVSKIVVVWLGGHPVYWKTAREFNLMQDIPAAQIVFDSGVPLVHIPCKNVAEHLRSTVWEMEKYVKGRVQSEISFLKDSVNIPRIISAGLKKYGIWLL